jgi:hypothetical protein
MLCINVSGHCGAIHKKTQLCPILFKIASFQEKSEPIQNRKAASMQTGKI